MGETVLFAYAKKRMRASYTGTAMALAKDRDPNGWYAMTLADLTAIFGPIVANNTLPQPQLEILTEWEVEAYA